MELKLLKFNLDRSTLLTDLKFLSWDHVLWDLPCTTQFNEMRPERRRKERTVLSSPINAPKCFDGSISRQAPFSISCSIIFARPNSL